MNHYEGGSCFTEIFTPSAYTCSERRCGFLDNELGKMVKIMQQCKRVNTSDDKCMDTLFDKVLELDAIMVEGYRGAKANINTLQ